MEEEISLRELIEILLKNKILITFITIACVIVSGIFSFFIIEPTYESEAKLLVADLKIPKPQENGIESIIDSASNYPTFNLESYKAQMKNPEILAEVIKELELDPEKYNIGSLANAITLENTKDTNIIKIKVKDKDPQKAADIANSLAKNFSDFISQLTEKQADKSLEYVEKQLAIEEKSLNEALIEYKKFLQQPQGVEEMESERDSKIGSLTKYKENLMQIDIDIATYKANLQAAEKQLENTDKFITTTKSITDDPLLSNYVQQKEGKNVEDISSIDMQSQEINPLYISLQNNISETELLLVQAQSVKTNLHNKINQIQKELENLQVNLAEKRHNLELLTRKVDTARAKYNALTDKSEEIRLAQSSKIGDSAIVVSSYAYPKEVPVAPRKALNLAIAMVLGVMLGVFIAFFREFWRATANETKQLMS